MKELQSSVSWDKLFMQHVYLIASKSKDPRTKIGAILVKDGVIISEGYNGFARGVKDLEERYVDRELKYKFVVHGEANAILNAVRHGVNTSGSTCYTQGVPCYECTKTLLQAGVKEIVVHNQYPNHSGPWAESAKISALMIHEAGIKLRGIDEVLGMTAFVDGKTHSV